MRWYRLAAEQGDADAQYSLGFMYATGDGVPENDAEAVKWYRFSAEQGNDRRTGRHGVIYASAARAYCKTMPRPHDGIA